jgi:hypothetical protein
MANIKNIIKAYTSELPENQEWYQKRLSICKACPHNSANGGAESTLSKVVEFVTNSDTCGACGCVITKKASVKEETCGLIHKPEWGKPRWNALAAASGANVKLESSDDKVRITGTKEGFLLDFGYVSEDVVDYSFVVKSDMTFKNITSTCGCSIPEAITEGSVTKISVRISTTKFTEGINKRTLYLNYIDKSNNEKKVQLTTIINKAK